MITHPKSAVAFCYGGLQLPNRADKCFTVRIIFLAIKGHIQRKDHSAVICAKRTLHVWMFWTDIKLLTLKKNPLAACYVIKSLHVIVLYGCIRKHTPMRSHLDAPVAIKHLQYFQI